MTQTTAHENQATEVARNCRQTGYSTVGDRKLYEGIQGAVEARGNPGGLNALKQITSINQQMGYPQYQQPQLADYPAEGGYGKGGQAAGQQQYPALAQTPYAQQPQAQLKGPGGAGEQKGGPPHGGGGAGGAPQGGPGGKQGASAGGKGQNFQNYGGGKGPGGYGGQQWGAQPMQGYGGGQMRNY